MHIGLKESEDSIPRKTLTFYWLIVGVILFSTLLNLPLQFEAQWVQTYIVRQSGTVILVMLAAELLFASVPNGRYRNYVVMLTGTIIANYLLIMNNANGLIPVVYLLPIFAAIPAFNRPLLVVCGMLNLSAYLLFYGMDIGFTAAPAETNLISIILLIVCSTISSMLVSDWLLGMMDKMRATERSKAELMIEKILFEKAAKTDLLTQLNNHNTFQEQLDVLVHQALRHGLSLHLAVLDIDNFKRVNDRFGHWAGDTVLKGLASVIRDTVANDDVAARYGGEEFTILLTGRTDEGALQCAEAVRTKMEALRFPDAGDTQVTVSIGLKRLEPGMSRETFFRSADTNLYKAKQSGKNRTVAD